MVFQFAHKIMYDAGRAREIRDVIAIQFLDGSASSDKSR